MGSWTWINILILGAVCVNAQVLPTVYEYYTEGGINSGLVASQGKFTLNGKDITLYSGSIHYYRVVPEYWRDRLRRMRAAGLNAIETYVPWNLHEPKKGVFDFGQGGNDFSRLLDIRTFLQIAQEEDLLVIFRPGPYICAEWEFGGLPSWLLRYPDIKVRTSDPIFVGHVRQYFDQLISQVVDLQFTRGGPIIAVQIENEYGIFGPGEEVKDRVYLGAIRDAYVENGIDQLLFTCDTPANSSDNGALPGYLQMANFNTDPEVQFELLKQLQPDMPLMAMEYWTGWFDHWFESGHNIGNTPDNFARYLQTIFSYNGSVNFYMFHGGSAFGFMNGANVFDFFPNYAADVSSYDYDAPLSEAGDYTEKYSRAQELIALDSKVSFLTPSPPPPNPKTIYPAVQMQEYLSYAQIIQQIPPESITQIDTVTNMEALDINDGNGQAYGLLVYRSQIDLPEIAQLQITGRIRDVGMVVVDNQQKTRRPGSQAALLGFGYWTTLDPSFNLGGAANGTNTLDVIIDNWGRNNFGTPGDFDQRKGLFGGPLSVDGVALSNLTAIPLEFKSAWVQNLTGWQTLAGGEILEGPLLLRTTFSITGAPTDTFLDMSAWSKGSIFVNGFHLGRFFRLGPVRTNYIPAPLLREGVNEVIVFEHYEPADQLVFTDTPILE
ncbi:beta-galactosidase-1-like protein 2 [Neocloeon triangulifer]|uniref:beta-galactosidase-1-like protein 2 n=1 Tax=Neocloeon triangulifer TaxID=2078957 RepID=UPI00286F4882|nr:beta-galactosidase-1-like protein 2 [Neocloeon triangulifer]